MSRCLWWSGAAVAGLLVVFGVTLRLSHKSIIRNKITQVMLHCFFFAFYLFTLSCLLLFPSNQEVIFSNGTEAYNNWQNPPVPVLFKVWIFNITNADEFEKNSSAILTFNEVGPYVYQEKKEKNIFRETQDTITFGPRSVFTFRSDLSGNLSLTDSFTTLNIPVLVSTPFSLFFPSSLFISLSFSSSLKVK